MEFGYCFDCGGCVWRGNGYGWLVGYYLLWWCFWIEDCVWWNDGRVSGLVVWVVCCVGGGVLDLGGVLFCEGGGGWKYVGE